MSTIINIDVHTLLTYTGSADMKGIRPSCNKFDVVGFVGDDILTGALHDLQLQLSAPLLSSLAPIKPANPCPPGKMADKMGSNSLHVNNNQHRTKSVLNFCRNVHKHTNTHSESDRLTESNDIINPVQCQQ